MTVLILSDLIARLGHEPQLLDLNQASFHKWLKIVTHDIGVQRKQNNQALSNSCEEIYRDLFNKLGYTIMV
jgi:hypothetical protein